MSLQHFKKTWVVRGNLDLLLQQNTLVAYNALLQAMHTKNRVCFFRTWLSKMRHCWFGARLDYTQQSTNRWWWVRNKDTDRLEMNGRCPPIRTLGKGLGHLYRSPYMTRYYDLCLRPVNELCHILFLKKIFLVFYNFLIISVRIKQLLVYSCKFEQGQNVVCIFEPPTQWDSCK